MYYAYWQYSFYKRKYPYEPVRIILKDSHVFKKPNRKLVIMNYIMIMNKKYATVKDFYDFLMSNIPVEELEYLGY